MNLLHEGWEDGNQPNRFLLAVEQKWEKHTLRYDRVFSE